MAHASQDEVLFMKTLIEIITDDKLWKVNRPKYYQQYYLKNKSKIIKRAQEYNKRNYVKSQRNVTE